MDKDSRKPELVIIAGPNGSGKTTVTQKFLHHEWSEGLIIADGLRLSGRGIRNKPVCQGLHE